MSASRKIRRVSPWSREKNERKKLFSPFLQTADNENKKTLRRVWALHSALASREPPLIRRLRESALKRTRNSTRRTPPTTPQRWHCDQVNDVIHIGSARKHHRLSQQQIERLKQQKKKPWQQQRRRRRAVGERVRLGETDIDFFSVTFELFKVNWTRRNRRV